MGREVKRVPVGWDWPIGKLWSGYVNPHYIPCSDCESGYSRAYDWLNEVMTAALRRMADPNAPADCKALYAALCDDQGRGNSRKGETDPWSAWHTVSRTLGRLAGLPSEECDYQTHPRDRPADWRSCPTCGGSNVRPDSFDAYHAWQREGPPKGDGWQLWSTTTEGHPMTPAFATPEELARFCADNRVSTFGPETADYSTWLAFIAGPGWSPSMVSGPGGVMSGVEAVVSGS